MTKYEKRIGFRTTKEGEIQLDYQKFAHYVKKEIKLICTENGEFWRYKNGVYKPISEERLKGFMADLILNTYPKFLTPKCEATYFFILKKIAFYGGKFNKHKNMICLKNGMYDIKKGTLLPHDKKYRCTMQIPIDYDKNAKCPEFEKFLKEVFKGNKKLIKVIQELLGYILIDSTAAQCFFIFYGTGSNGKSVLANIFMKFVGEGNYTNVSIRNLNRNFSRAKLSKVALNISTENEPSSGKLLDSQYIKAISSGDSIDAEFKGKDVFSFKPTCKLIFCTNTLPQFNDKSDGFYRRIMIVPFEAHFSIADGTADINIEKKLTVEMSGILNFALEGLERLRENNFAFTKSKKMNRLKSFYKKLVNPYEDFWYERVTTKAPNNNIMNTKKEFYNEFLAWCLENKHTRYANVTPRKFWLEFGQVFYSKLNEKLEYKKSGNNRYVCDIYLKNSTPTVRGRKLPERPKFVLDDTYDEASDTDEDI